MEPVHKELTLEESVKQVMQTLPPAIRSYLAQGRHTPVAKNLMAKYGLRVDQGGILEREIILLLMGVENPEEFTQSLVQEANLGQDTIAGIVRDVNAQIFAPLREEMRHPPTPAPEPAKPAPQVYAPPPQSPAYVRPESPAAPAVPSAPTLNTGRAPSRIAPLPPKTVLPRWQSQTLPTASGQPQTLRLEDHEEPHIEFHSPSPKAAESGVKAPPPAPEPPPNLPGALPPRPASPPAVPKSPQGAVPPPKSYSADPYREPIE